MRVPFLTTESGAGEANTTHWSRAGPLRKAGAGIRAFTTGGAGMETIDHEAEVSTSPKPVLNEARSDVVTVVSPLRNQAITVCRVSLLQQVRLYSSASNFLSRDTPSRSTPYPKTLGVSHRSPSTSPAPCRLLNPSAEAQPYTHSHPHPPTPRMEDATWAPSSAPGTRKGYQRQHSGRQPGPLPANVPGPRSNFT